MSDQMERALAALDAATESFEAIEDVSAIESFAKEQETIDTLTDELAECYIDGLQTEQGRFATAISESSSLNKTEAKSEIDRKIREKEAEEQSPVNVWVADNLDEVRVIRTTDHVSDTRYVWEFSDGTTVETASGTGHRSHFAWPDFRDEIWEAGGPYLNTPESDYADGQEWREFIVRLQNQHKIEKESTGPRTKAIEYLRTRIRNADGFGQLADAADYQGVYVEIDEDRPAEEDPVDTESPQQDCPLWRVDEIMFPNDWAKSASEEYEVTTRAVQNELSARGYTLGDRSVSSTEYVDGRYPTFWKLNGTFASPASYQPDADADPAEEDDTVSDTPADTDTDGPDSDAEEGNFGTIGGDV
jgi:hypothetical protein